MNSLVDRVKSNPMLLRIAPFAVFLVFTSLQGKLGAHSQFWCYMAKIVLGAGLILWMRPLVTEMRWNFSWEAVVAGVAVFVIWVGLDPFYPKPFGAGGGWNPFNAFPDSPALAWALVIGRILGSTLVVPPLEEVFYRSFVYRYIVKVDFLDVRLNEFKLGPFLIAAVIFGFAHFEWLAGILCAFAYHGLIFRKNRLGDAILAHAITNFLLGLYVVGRSAWNFW